MYRYLFKRKFYSCLYRAYVESAIENCTTIKYRPALLCTFYYIFVFLIVIPVTAYYIYEYGATSMSSGLTIILCLGLVYLVAYFVTLLNDLFEKAKEMLNEMDTIETPTASDASDTESAAIAAYQSEQFMNWFYKGPHLERWPHSRITQSDDCEALRNLRQTNKKLRRNYEKLCSQRSPDSAVSETSFIESEQEICEESNLHLPAEHRSLHPSGSLEEHAGSTLRSRHPSGSLEEHAGSTESLNPSISSEEQAISSTFVTVAEVHRSNNEESD